MTLEDDLPIPPVEGAPGALTNWVYVNAFLRAWWGYSPGDFEAAGGGGGGGAGADAIRLTDFGAVAGANVHTNGPLIQEFYDSALSTGQRHLVDAGIWNLESANGVPYIPILDAVNGGSGATNTGTGLAGAVTGGLGAEFNRTVIEWEPGAVFRSPDPFGVPDVATSGGTYFTGATRSAKVVTLTVPTGHGIVAGNSIEVYCPTWDFDNGDFTVTSVTGTTIVYTQISTGGTTPDTTHAGWVKAYVSCFRAINFDLSHDCQLINPQFDGPGGFTNNPNNDTQATPAIGSGPLFASRVEHHGLISNGYFAGLEVSGADGSNTDHHHAYDVKSTSGNYVGVMWRQMLASGTRDFRWDTGAYGPCQHAGWLVSLGAYLSDFKGHDQHFNASPYAIKKQGFRGVPLGTGGGAQLFDDAEWGGTSKAEGSGNGAWNGGEAVMEKVGGSFRVHGIEINVGSHAAGQHTLRDITLASVTRSTTVLTSVYSRTSTGTSVSGSCVVTGLTADRFTWRDVGCQFIKGTDFPLFNDGVSQGTLIVAILSPTSIVVSDDATASSTSTCYSVPRLLVGDHLAVYSDDETLNCPAIIKTLSGTGRWGVGGAGPFTLTAESVAQSGTISPGIAATAGVTFGLRGGVMQHTIKPLALSIQSDPNSSDTATELYWDFDDLDACRFITARHPNAHTGYSAYPSVNLRNGSAASLRTVFEHGDDEVMLVKALGTIAAGECTEIGSGGSRRKSTVDPTRLRGGEALQPAATTTSHGTGDTQTTRPYFWVARKGSFRSTSGWPGIKVAGVVASGDVLVEDPAGTDGTAKAWTTGAGMRIVGVATGANSGGGGGGGVCPYEVMPGESWTV